MTRVLEDWTAIRLWLVVFITGFAIGWVTVQPAWPLGAFAAGGVAAFVVVKTRRRS